MASMAKKKILGRQKIPMKKIEKKSSLQVSFSKRRSGLFKKASELSVLCGAEISIVAFSPAGKAFSFGNPSVESVVNRYLDANRGGYDCSSTPLHSQHHDDLHHLSDHWDNREYMNLAAMLGEERRKKAAMEEKMQKNGADGWMDFVDVNIDEMGLQELQQLKMRLEDLKSSISGYTLVPSENPMPVLVPSENPTMFEAVPSGEMMFQTMPCEDSLVEWFLGLPTPLPDYLF